MLSFKKELSVPTYQVHTTTDYSMFRSIDGNRNLNLLHINRLKKSMQEHYLFTVIVVNERYEIIDGQHRFNSIRDLGLPLHYVVMTGYNLAHVQILNANSSNWSTQDYLQAYCDLGYEDYLRLSEFLRKYKLNITIGASILIGNTTGQGAMPGMPDLMICISNGPYHALFVEMKTEKGKLSEMQKIVHAQLINAGYCVKVCRSFDEFTKTIKTYFEQ